MEKWYVIENKEHQAIYARPQNDYIKKEFQAKVKKTHGDWTLHEGERIEMDAYDPKKYKRFTCFIDFDEHLTSTDPNKVELEISKLENALAIVDSNQDIYFIGILN